MADQAAPNLAGIDFSQYRSWAQITTPRGGVYYVVPGTPYVYDPFASAARKQTVLYLNPTPEIEDRKRQQDMQNAQMRSQSPEGQLIPVVGTVGGTAAAASFYNNNPFSVNPKPVEVPNQPVQNVQPTVQQPAPPTAQPTTPSQGFVQGAQTGSVPTIQTGNTVPAGAAVPEGYTAIGSSADGGTIIAPTDQVNAIPDEALSDPGFLQSVNWGQVVQGGLALAQLYGAYKEYKKGNYAGAGITGAAGAGNLAMASGAVSQSGTLGGTVIPGLNIAAGVYTGYKTGEALGNMAAGGQRTTMGVVGGASSGAAIGAGVGSIVPGVGTAIGAGVGAVVGAIAGLAGDKFGSSKGKAQFMRDGIRGELQKGGILDENYQGTLADGSKYDFGKDGSTLKWKEIDKIAQANKNAWGAAVPLTDALATAYGFVGQKASDISAWYAKGAVSNAGDNPEVARANARHFAQQQGITFEMIKQKLDDAKKDNRINENEYNYYLAGARDLTSYGSSPKSGVASAGAPAVPATPASPQVARSRTVSPGIDMQGKRLNYSDMGRQLAERYNRRRR